MKSTPSNAKRVGLLLSVALTALGCGASPGPGTGPGENDGGVARPGDAGATGEGGADAADGADGAEEGACGPVDPALASRDAAELFGYDHVPTFDLYLPAAQWASLQANARDEQYVAAQACFEGTSVGRVGLRFKGADGSLFGCFNDQGEMICRKLGMKIKFSEYDRQRRFFGLKRLNFNANSDDDSRIWEKLAFDLYRAMGVVAPRALWAVLRVNDESLGLFSMVEQVDGRFTADRWPNNKDGNLYKEVWPTLTDAATARSHLETNEELADVSAFVAFSNAMNAAGDAQLRSTLAGYMDLDALARYMAVDDAIINNDGITALWTAADRSWTKNHNSYLYEDAPGHFTLVPWDLDSVFPAAGSFPPVPHWTVVPADCDELYPTSDAYLAAPGCDRTFRAMAADLTAWRAAGQQLLAGPFSEATMVAAIDQAASFVRAQALADPTPSTVAPFEEAVADLRRRVPGLRGRFERRLAGLPWKAMEIDVAGLTGFEDQDDGSVAAGTTWYGCNPNSTIAGGINTTDPMQGAKDLRLSFEFANEADPYQQWCSYIIPVTAGADLTPRTGIRFWVRADQPRTLRLDIDTPHASAANDYTRYGWDVSVTAQAAQVELLFANAAIPALAAAPGYTIQDALAATTGFLFSPAVVNLDATGQLPAGTKDSGALYFDDFEFF